MQDEHELDPVQKYSTKALLKMGPTQHDQPNFSFD